MLAFASNSLLCRVALKANHIDPASFTFVRIASGAVALWGITMARRGVVKLNNHSSPRVAWVSPIALFAYAAAFSFAYRDLPAGTGALLLFGAVQATMILWGLHKGERLYPAQIVGLVAAAGGLVALVFPGLSAPPLVASILMLISGSAWGIYSLRGRGSTDPISATTSNFLRAAPFAAALALAMAVRIHGDSSGLWNAILSGAVTSGVGYIIWYIALPGLKATTAATVQLSVPVLAATGGILLLGEPITLRFALASLAVLGGIALVVLERPREVGASVSR